LLARLDEIAKQKYVPSIYKAFIYAGLDDNDQAFDWFEKAYRASQLPDLLEC